MARLGENFLIDDSTHLTNWALLKYPTADPVWLLMPDVETSNKMPALPSNIQDRRAVTRRVPNSGIHWLRPYFRRLQVFPILK